MYGALYSLELNLTFTGPTSGMYIHGQVLVPGSVGNDGHVVASVGGACKSSSFPITGMRLVNTSITAPTSPGGAGTTIEVWGVTAND